MPLSTADDMKVSTAWIRREFLQSRRIRKRGEEIDPLLVLSSSSSFSYPYILSSFFLGVNLSLSFGGLSFLSSRLLLLLPASLSLPNWILSCPASLSRFALISFLLLSLLHLFFVLLLHLFVSPAFLECLFPFPVSISVSSSSCCLSSFSSSSLLLYSSSSLRLLLLFFIFSLALLFLFFFFQEVRC